MKRGLALLLSLSLMLGQAAPVLAETSENAADESAAFAASYDSRSEAVIYPENGLSAAEIAAFAAADNTGTLFEGDKVTFLKDETGKPVYRMTAAQKAFALAKSGELQEASWFAMNDPITSLGTVEERIKQALAEHRIVLLGDDYEIIGWDEAHENTPSAAEDKAEGTPASEPAADTADGTDGTETDPVSQEETSVPAAADAPGEPASEDASEGADTGTDQTNTDVDGSAPADGTESTDTPGGADGGLTDTIGTAAENNAPEVLEGTEASLNGAASDTGTVELGEESEDVTLNAEPQDTASATDSSADEAPAATENASGETPTAPDSSAYLTQDVTDSPADETAAANTDNKTDESAPDDVLTESEASAPLMTGLMDETAGTESAAAEEESADTGAWLVRSLTDGAVDYRAYDDEAIADLEILTLLFAEPSLETITWRADGGIGDGRLLTHVYTEEELAALEAAASGSPDSEEIDSETSAEPLIPSHWMASVYTAEESASLTDVSFYTDTLHTSYEIQIRLEDRSLMTAKYDGFGRLIRAGVNTETDGPLAAMPAVYAEPLTGKVTGRGLHAVELPEKIDLKAGQAFAICVRFADDRKALMYDTAASAYDEAGAELYASTSAVAEKAALISADGETWEVFEAGTGNAWRIGAAGVPRAEEAPLNTATSDVLTDGAVYVIHPAGNKNYALDVKGGSVAIRTNVQIYKNNGNNSQKWFAVKNSDGTWSFVSYLAGRALDVEGNNNAGKTNVQIHTPRFKDSQRFKLAEAGSGSYYIRHVDSWLNLDVAGGKYQNSANIQVYKKNDSMAQKFTFEKISERDMSGEYMIAMAANRNSVLGVEGASQATDANISVQARNMNDEQVFILTKVEGGYYKIVNKNSNMPLSIKTRAAAGKNVKQIRDSNSDLQLFRVVINDDGTVSLFSKALNNICVEVEGGKTAAGTNARAASFTKAKQQKFYLVSTTKGLLDGTYTVRSALYPDRVFDVADASTADGANIRSYNDNGTAAQQFIFEKVSLKSAEPVYYIINKNSKKLLGYTGALASKANLVQDNTARTDAHKWYIKTNSDGTYTICPNANRNLVLDIESASLNYRANIRVYKSNGTKAQKWYLSSMRVSKCALTSASAIQVTGTTGDVVGDDNKIYLFAVDPTNFTSIGNPLASTGDGSSFTLSGSVGDIQVNINKEFFTGIKVDGKYHLTSNGMYITNPEKAAKKTVARTKPLNKKGLAIDWTQSLVNEAINTLHVKNVAINIPLIQVVSTNANSAPNFTYGGVQYRFNGVIASSFKDRVRELNKAGVQVTCIVYADAGMCSSFPEYVTPGGRGGQAAGAALVGMNAQEAAGRKKLEAAFAFLASTFSDADAHVDNWVIGNELDNPVTWNYCGESLALDYYATLYAQVYRLAYNAMKSVWSNVRVYDSLDNVWTVTSRGPRYYTAKDFQDTFAKVIKGEGNIKWGLAFHPYCAPELDPRFWKYPEYATTNGSTTPRITLLNIQVLPAYVESQYGSGHPIILSETGINAIYNGKDYSNAQAAAIAYGYYKVEMTSGLDNLIIHTYKDTAGEVAGGWYLGIRKQDGTKRPAYNVFANMDGKKNGPKYTTVNKYGGKTLVQTINSKKTKWSELLPGFSMSGFQDTRY